MSQARQQHTRGQEVRHQKYDRKERSVRCQRLSEGLGSNCEGPCMSHAKTSVWVLSESPCKAIEKLVFGMVRVGFRIREKSKS